MNSHAADCSPEDQQSLIRNLRRPDAFPHPAADIACIETHISSVVLAGDFAYKLKKPLDLGFLDFSSLDKRRGACDEELRLNRRTAPELYLDVVPVTGSVEAPHIGGEGEPIEYAVRMRRFAQSALLGDALERGALPPELLDRLARHVADFHAAAAIAAPGDGYGDAQAVHGPVRQNFAQLREFIDDAGLLAQAAAAERWSEAQFALLAPVFERRLAEGRVRECHGDLHLGNLILLDGEPRLFDGIEFSAELRWIDVAADVAFLFMDLQRRGRSDLGARFLNAWLERTGDYDSLRVMRYYIAYRAMVRAKIAAIRLAQLDGEARADCLQECRAYVALAVAQGQAAQPFLAIASGVSGSGKTSQSQGLIEARGVIRVRADVERKRLFGLAAEDSSVAVAGGIYNAEASRRTYARLAEVAAIALMTSWPVLADATFLRRGQRAAFAELARRLQVPFAILAFDAPEATLRARVAARAARGGDASEADVAVLDVQLALREPLSDDERAMTLAVDTATAVSWPSLLPALDALVARQSARFGHSGGGL
ncbi:bifunctional aminoglycoside phosphotransferase/ATP-binding protein [Thauera sp. 2A1]|uniref:bifunctional aminoglycoside phosphotransferase/ATP-binding protein n=1 Tax=Thauera sp. 2A1 TaxID=2570191 RepID=UPI0012914BD9|nr:bifunctional aminoglycoside phosphotransferase/ATP-binding protein [Thauera sp. 2A1]KAI5915164.1 AAA family ATPase [Thauera sp. 2A1]